MVERLPSYTAPSTGPRRVIYRIRQFVQGFNARIEPKEREFVTGFLTGPALDLFTSMPQDAQRHSLNVLYGTQASGNHNPDLAVAALLHDVGKMAASREGLRLDLWMRGPLVLLEAIASQTLYELADATPAAGWRYIVHVHLHHPQIGAELAEQAGCSELTCWLIRYHQHQPQEVAGAEEELQLLSLLQRADNSN